MNLKKIITVVWFVMIAGSILTIIEGLIILFGLQASIIELELRLRMAQWCIGLGLSVGSLSFATFHVLIQEE